MLNKQLLTDIEITQVDTADKHSFAPRISKKIEMVLMGYSVVRGKLIHEKNLKLKISLRLPLMKRTGQPELTQGDCFIPGGGGGLY
jgi:hypothetical protein